MEAQEKNKISHEESLIRIMSTDIAGNKTVYSGLTKIKGVSWSLANGICHQLKIDKNKKVGELSKEEIEKIGEFIKNPNVPKFLVNRRKDFETGEDKHLSTSDLDLQKEFDIKRLRKIKSYKGVRHGTDGTVKK